MKQFDPQATVEHSAVGAMTEVTLTPQQMKLWTETRTALLWNHPAFSHILYTMCNPRKSPQLAFFTRDVPIAATDGVNLIFNPDTFFKYNLQQRLFIVVHEIMHCIYNHCGQGHAFRMRGKVALPNGKDLPYSAEAMNVATDLVINDLLVSGKVGEYSKDWLHDPKIGTKSDSAIDVYAKVLKVLPPPPGGQGQKPGDQPTGGHGMNGQKGFDNHLAPGTVQGQDPVTAQGKRNEQEWKVNVAAARDAAKAQGKLPAEIERFFNQILEPEIDWKEQIRGFFSRTVGSDAWNWTKPDRQWLVRDLVIPSRSGFAAGDVVLAIDTSGSIGQTELDVFFAEMKGILAEVKPRRTFVLWVDAKLHKVDEVEGDADVDQLKPKGGGGTDFNPPFKWCEDEGIKPDALVYFTDLYGPFPAQSPGYPVVWARTDKRVAPPWGEIVDLPFKS